MTTKTIPQKLTCLLILACVPFWVGCSGETSGGFELGQDEPKGGHLNQGAEGPEYDLYIGVSDSTGARSYLKRFQFNSDTNSVTDSSYVQMSYNGEFRGMDVDKDGNMVVANAQLSSPLEIVDLSDSSSLVVSGSITPDLGAHTDKDTSRNHTVCVLPNGNKVIGGYNPSNDVHLNEYTSDGVYLQTIHTSTYGSFNISMNKCVSRSNLEIYFLDANSSVSGGAKLMRFTRPDVLSPWAVADQVLDSDFDTANGTSGSSFWALAVDPDNGYVYVSRYMDTGTQAKKMIRCPATGFNSSNCVGVGDDVPGDARIKSMIVIPGTGGDLLVFTFLPNHSIYRFNQSDGSWTSLFDLTTMDLGSDTYGQPWAKAILK